jgi:hypothetical protein
MAVNARKRSSGPPTRFYRVTCASARRAVARTDEDTKDFDDVEADRYVPAASRVRMQRVLPDTLQYAAVADRGDSVVPRG